MSKADSLNLILELGLRTPPFFVVNELDGMSEIIKKLNPSKRYAVRSSANLEDGVKNSFAGVFNTYLNLSTAQVEKGIKNCFDLSLCPGLEEYLNHFGIDKRSLRMQAIVQESVDSEVSGVAFSRHPHGGDYPIIEAVWGLGEGLVSGIYTPDIIKIDGENMDYKLSFQYKMLRGGDCGVVEEVVPYLKQSARKLTENRVKKILSAIEVIKKSYPVSFEIEWGFSKGKLYVFQIRPSTAKQG